MSLASAARISKKHPHENFIILEKVKKFHYLPFWIKNLNLLTLERALFNIAKATSTHFRTYMYKVSLKKFHMSTPADDMPPTFSVRPSS